MEWSALKEHGKRSGINAIMALGSSHETGIVHMVRHQRRQLITMMEVRARALDSLYQAHIKSPKAPSTCHQS